MAILMRLARPCGLVAALALAAALGAAPIHSAVAQTQEFAVISLHDIADNPAGMDSSGVSTDRLVTFFEWLIGNDWQAISLSDVESARRGEARLPERAVLITVDDGYASLYTRVYPLALAYEIPVLAALVGEWLDVPASGEVSYGGGKRPRSHFITWAQAREMQASGLVEFASHTYDLHHEERANPQGNMLAAGVTRRYDPARGYESEADYAERLRADFERSRAQFEQQLGQSPRAMVWPYGRYNQASSKIAREIGFSYSLTLDPRPGRVPQAEDAAPYVIGRYLPTNNPPLGEWVHAMRFADPWPNARRMVTVDPRDYASDNPQEADERLGQALEALLELGVTHVVINAVIVDASGQAQAAWFPTEQLPLRADVLSRLAAQIRTRAGVELVLRLPHRAALRGLGTAERVLKLFRDLGRSVPFDVLLVEQAASFEDGRAVTTPWDVRALRAQLDTASWPAPDRLAMQVFYAASAAHPGLKLFWLAPPDHDLTRPSALAELTLLPLRLDGAGALPPQAERLIPGSVAARRTGLWWEASETVDAAALIEAVRAYQRHGGTSVLWHPQDLLRDQPPAARLAPVVSARSFPAASALRP